MAVEPAQSPEAGPSTLPSPLADYRLAYTLHGHVGRVSAVKFSPDGTKLASSSEDGLVCLWDSATGKHLRSLYGHEKGVSDIAFSSDSRFLASGSNDHSVRIWSVEEGVAFHEPLQAHQDAILCLAFNPQGNLLASGGKDECVWLWDVRRGRPHLTLPAHSDPVSGVHFNRDGTMLVSCSWDGLIRLWDTSSGQCLKTLVHDDSVPIAHVSFSPSGRHLLSTTLDSTTRIWEYHNSKCIKTYSGALLEKYGCPSTFMLHPLPRPSPHDDKAARKGKGKGNGKNKGKGKEVSADPAEVWVVGGSEDGRVLGWELQSRKIVLEIKSPDGPILSVAAHPSLPRIASASVGSAPGKIRIWHHHIQDVSSEVEEPKPVYLLEVNEDLVADPTAAEKLVARDEEDQNPALPKGDEDVGMSIDDSGVSGTSDVAVMEDKREGRLESADGSGSAGRERVEVENKQTNGPEAEMDVDADAVGT